MTTDQSTKVDRYLKRLDKNIREMNRIINVLHAHYPCMASRDHLGKAEIAWFRAEEAFRLFLRDA